MRISLVIPAYNEEERLPAFLSDVADFHQTHHRCLAEVLIVDDGSSDRTASSAEEFRSRLPLRVIRILQNRGKGAAVRAGIQQAEGDAVVFMDADGATSPRELPKLALALERSPIAVGNRWMPGARVRDREPFRAFSGWVYRAYVGMFGLKDIDTMCGFKGFRTSVARSLFQRLYDQRWLFDFEIMLRAKRHGFRVANLPILWTSKHGSKLRPLILARAVFQIPLLALRVWRER